MNTRTARIIRMRRKRRIARRGNVSVVFRWLVAGVILLISLAFAGVGGVAAAMVGTYLYYAQELPPPSRIATLQDQAFETTMLYDRTGMTVIYEIVPPLEGDRQKISIYDVPQHFLDATIAIEDASYYENPGFDLRGISRALWQNFQGGNVQGGSTITQQLVKNALIDEEQRAAVSVDRKIQELILASEISRLYSKDQILEWYINTNFYGNLAYGIEAASQVYFNKSARNLTLGEAALLAAIPQFPMQNPIDNPTAARLRQELVLSRMVNLGHISQAQMDDALAEDIEIRPLGERYEIIAPHFSLYARNEAQGILNRQGLDGAYLVSRGGLRIYTTLDVDLQNQMECVARTHTTRLDTGAEDFVQIGPDGTPCTAAAALPPISDELTEVARPVKNAAGVVIRAETGEIIALMGSVDYWDESIDGNYNVVTAERQPGSVFKPFVYLAAFVTPINQSTIVTPATMLSDAPIEFNNGGSPYAPQNIDRLFHGPTNVREALARSYNVPVVQVLNWVGLGPVISTAHRMGINSLNEENHNAYGLSLALGTGEVSLIDITYAYNVFNTLGYGVGTPVPSNEARQGYRQLNPTSILRIEDKSGRVLWEYSETRGTFDRRSIIPAGMAYIMTDILADADARYDAFPRGNPLELPFPAAAKTGTTDDNRDSWTIGYMPEYTVGIWVGNNDNTSMQDITGMTGAAPIWHATMAYLHARDNLSTTGWQRPATVAEQTVCLWSGLLPTQNCSQVPGELFYVDSVLGVDYRPQKPDDKWYRLPIDICNNTRANNSTPPQCVQEQIFFEFPPELMEWARANTPELLPPAEEGFVPAGTQFSPIAIVSPRFPDQVSGEVEIFGNTNVENLSFFQLGYGAGNEPANFIQIGQNGTDAGFNQSLGTWDTTPLEDGLYTLSLQVVQQDNNVQTIYTRISVDNTPPEIRLIEPTQNTSYSAANEGVIVLESEVFDVGNIEKVEFYRQPITDNSHPAEAVLIGESTVFPYIFPWAIEGEGQNVFWGVAIDRAGNRTESTRVTVTLQ